MIPFRPNSAARPIVAGLLALVIAVAAAALPGPSAAQVMPGTGEPAAADAAAQDAALGPLLDALENPETRDRLIAALRDAAGPDAADAATGADPAPAEDQTLAARLAASSVELVAGVTGQITQSLRDIQRLGLLPSLLTEDRRARIADEGLDLLLTIVVTALIYRALRILSRRLRLGMRPRDADLGTLAKVFAGQFVLRLLSLVLAWVAGYGLAIFVLNDGTPALAQALYLNAFLVFGIFSLVLTVFVSRHPEDLTFSRLPQVAEATIARNIRRTVGVLFYGLIAAVPIAQDWTNFVISRSLRTVVLTLVAVMAVLAIRRIAASLRAERAAEAERAAAAQTVPEPGAETDDPGETLTGSFVAGSLGLWDRIWPPLAYLYVAVAYVVSLANPNVVFELVGRATALSALSLVAIMIGLRLLARATSRPTLPMPRSLELALPSLGQRLSTFLPPLLVAAGLGLFGVAVLLIVEGWQLADVAGWLVGSGGDLMWRIASVLLILLFFAVAWAVLSAWIDRRLSADLPGQAVSARSRTLLALFRNALSIALIVFGGMIALSELGIDIAPLLAGAGVIGLAVGFGAQKLVQDIITGVFIQLENAINEGDVITVAGITGGVERLTIRSVGLRDLSGAYHLIPFSAVDTVANYMRLFAYHVEVVGVAYDTDLEKAEKALHEAFDALKAGPHGEAILAPLEYHGVVGLADSAVNIRVRIKTRPGQQWALGRAYTREVKRALDAAGIEIPFPHRELKLPDALIKRLGGPDPSAATG